MLADSLEYAPARRRSWFAEHRRMLATLSLSLVGGLFVWHFGPGVMLPIRVVYLQRRALACVTANDFCVVRSELDRKSPSLKFPMHDQNFSGVDPWNRYLESASLRKGAILFVGRRVSSAGHDRIVMAYSVGNFQMLMNPVPTGTPSAPPNSEHFAILAHALTTGTLTKLPTILAPTHNGLGGETLSEDVLQIFAGQPDPVDRSHFTIAYQSGAARGTIDGWLQDDESVRLQIRDGPALAGTVQSLR